VFIVFMFYCGVMWMVVSESIPLFETGGQREKKCRKGLNHRPPDIVCISNFLANYRDKLLRSC